MWFEEFLYDNEDIWLEEDRDFCTSSTFLTEEQRKKLDCEPNRDSRIAFVKRCIIEDHTELLSWMRKLRLYYETGTQIFVHAGVDEEIPEEEIEWCTLGTSAETMVGIDNYAVLDSGVIPVLIAYL